MSNQSSYKLDLLYSNKFINLLLKKQLLWQLSPNKKLFKLETKNYNRQIKYNPYLKSPARLIKISNTLPYSPTSPYSTLFRTLSRKTSTNTSWVSSQGSVWMISVFRISVNCESEVERKLQVIRFRKGYLQSFCCEDTK
jgi:hypothetical protein